MATAAVTSDINAAITGTATVEVIDWASGPGDGPVHTVTLPFTLAPLDSATVWQSGVDVLLKAAGGWPKDRVFARLTFKAGPGPAGAATQTAVPELVLETEEEDEPSSVASFAPTNAAHHAPKPAAKAGGAPAAGGRALLATKASPAPKVSASWEGSYPLFFTELKDAAINPKPRVSFTNFTQVGADKVTFTVSASGVAPYVALDTALPGTFSDNNFFLMPWEPLALTFTASSAPNSGVGAAVDAAALKASLKVMSLGDTLNSASTLYA